MLLPILSAATGIEILAGDPDRAHLSLGVPVLNHSYSGVDPKDGSPVAEAEDSTLAFAQATHLHTAATVTPLPVQPVGSLGPPGSAVGAWTPAYAVLGDDFEGTVLTPPPRA